MYRMSPSFLDPKWAEIVMVSSFTSPVGFREFFRWYAPFQTFVVCRISELNFDYMHIWLRDPLNSPLEAHLIEGLGKDLNVFEVSCGHGGMFCAHFFVCLPHS